MPNKYLAYSRVSQKPGQDDAATSIPHQNRQIFEYADRNGLTVLKLYSEQRSAHSGTRKGFEQMLEHLEDPDVDGVIFHKLDRSSRNVGDFAKLDLMMAQGKDIRIINGQFDTSKAAGRLAFRNHSNMCVWYSENLSEEVTAKMGELLRRGYFPAHPPIGYRTGIKGKDADPKKKYPDERLAPYVKECFRLYATGAFSLRTLTAHMRDHGMVNSKGGNVRAHVFERLLKNPFYYGVIEWKSQKTGKLTHYAGCHEPIISKELFDQVQEVIEGKVGASKSKHDYTYARLIECECGRKLVSSIHKGRVYLECKNESCGFTSITEERLEDRIIAFLARYALEPDFVEWVEEAWFRATEGSYVLAEEKVASLRIELQEVEQRVSRVNDALLDGALSSSEAIERKSDIVKRRVALTQEIRTLEARIDGKENNQLPNFVHGLKNFDQLYRSLSPVQKRQTLLDLSSNRRLEGSALLIEAKSEVEHLRVLQQMYSVRSNLGPDGLKWLREVIPSMIPERELVELHGGGPYPTTFELMSRWVDDLLQNLLSGWHWRKSDAPPSIEDAA